MSSEIEISKCLISVVHLFQKSASSRNRPKLLISLSHHVFLGHPSDSFYIHSLTMFNPITVIFMFHIPKPVKKSGLDVWNVKMTLTGSNAQTAFYVNTLHRPVSM